MKESKGDHNEMRMQMWKKRDEMLKSLSDKELRAFLKGYMMGEHMAFRRARKIIKASNCGSCGCGCCGNSCSDEQK